MSATTGMAVLGSGAAAVLLFVTGANDVANALGTSIGSRALNLKQACIVASVFELLGASIIGGSVANTLGDSIVHKCYFVGPYNFVACMLAALVGAATWVALATKYSLPVSSTHAVIGGVVSCALIDGGASAVGGYKLALTALYWVISPVLGGLVSALVYHISNIFILKQNRANKRGKDAAPYLIGGTGAALALFVLLGAHAIPKLAWWIYIIVTTAIFVLGSITAKCFVVPYFTQKWNQKYSVNTLAEDLSSPETSLADEDGQNTDAQGLEVSIIECEAVATKTDPEVDKMSKMFEEASESLNQADRQDLMSGTIFKRSAVSSKSAEKWFIIPMVMTACGVSFAHGGNDIANAIGPLSEILLYTLHGSLSGSHDAAGSLWYVTLVGGLFLVLGLATWGKNVMETVGSGITRLTYSKGFAAQFGAALAVLIATIMGFPISTTAVLIGSITGVGFTSSSGKERVNYSMIGKIVLGWIVTLPIAGGLSAVFFLIARALLEKEPNWEEADPSSNCTNLIVVRSL